MFERHTEQAMFDMVEKVLDEIRPGCKDLLTGFATDGETNMNGRHARLLTFSDHATVAKFYSSLV